MSLNEVLANVEKHVAKGVAYLGGRSEKLKVESPRDHPPTSLEDPIDRPCESRRDRLHAARQRIRGLGLDDEMKMIILNRIFYESEVPALTRLRKGSSHLENQRSTAKAREPIHDPQRHMRRSEPVERISSTMRFPIPP